MHTPFLKLIIEAALQFLLKIQITRFFFKKWGGGRDNLLPWIRQCSTANINGT